MVAWKFLARLKDRKGLGLRFIMAKKKKKNKAMLFKWLWWYNNNVSIA
jgi:hypothetical protein